MAKSEHKVGDTLWVTDYNRGGYEVTVTKVGNKYVSFKLSPNSREQRFEIGTTTVDAGGYSSTQQVWPSKEAHEAHCAKGKAWEVFREGCKKISSKDLTLEQIAEVRRILGI